MLLRSAQVFKKSVVSRLAAGDSPAAPTDPAANAAPFLPGRFARIFSGRRISTRWPVLLRSSTRKALISSSWRAGPLDKPRSRATDITAKCRRSLPATREMAQEIGVHGPVPDGQAETRGENIFKLLWRLVFCLALVEVLK